MKFVLRTLFPRLLLLLLLLVGQQASYWHGLAHATGDIAGQAQGHGTGEDEEACPDCIGFAGLGALAAGGGPGSFVLQPGLGLVAVQQGHCFALASRLFDSRAPPLIG